MPFSSRSLTKDASVYLAGAWVKCCFPSSKEAFKTSPSSSSGNELSSSSLIAYSYIFMNPSNLIVDPVALNL